MELISKLGFNVNDRKSVLEPTQCLTFLGFKIDSINMQVSPTEDKKEKLKLVITEINEEDKSIQQVAGLVGLMVVYALSV